MRYEGRESTVSALLCTHWNNLYNVYMIFTMKSRSLVIAPVKLSLVFFLSLIVKISSERTFLVFIYLHVDKMLKTARGKAVGRSLFNKVYDRSICWCYWWWSIHLLLYVCLSVAIVLSLRLQLLCCRCVCSGCVVGVYVAVVLWVCM